MKNQNSILPRRDKIKITGFTLVEALVFLFIFALITVTFYKVYTVGIQYIINSRNRLAATALADEKMEIIRNMAFDDIAHTSGSPAGNLNQNEDITRSGALFHIWTQIKNQDDEFDGKCLGADTSDCAAFVDYKDVRITVSWNGGQYEVTLNSRFVPAGIEQPSTGLGVLVINVSSDKNGGAMVQQSTVRIQNSDLNPDIDETHSTDNYGRLVMVGLPESIKKYQITVTKSGWETVSTLPPYPGTAYNPTHEHASVVEAAVNTLNIYQNELSNLTVASKDYLGNSVPDINFHLTGGRKIGTTYAPNPGDPSDPIYGLAGGFVTNASGEKSFNDANPGPYTFTLTKTGYKVIGTSPLPSFSLAPGDSSIFNVKVSSENVTALLVKVAEGINGNPLSGASVHLTNGASPPYDVTLTTGDGGMAFFPNTETPAFEAGTYNLAIAATGYQDHSGTVTVNSNELKEENISLTLP